jgi:hypothetical protein
MAAQPSQEDFFSFVGGLNTEGGYFLTPKNSWKEGDNVVPQKDGSIQRRNAINLEQNYVYSATGIVDTTIDSYAFSTHIWQDVGGNGNKNILVCQFGQYVYFYDASTTTTSTTKYSFEIYLPDYQAFANSSLIGAAVISCADCYGKLIITSQDTDPIAILYESDTEFVVKRLDLKMRDFDGIPSPISSDQEKTQAEWENINFWPEALYNLYNQGWKDDKLAVYVTNTAGKYPANSKQWIRGKNTTDDFDTTVLAKIDFGTSLAPKGRVILSAFNQDRAKSLLTLDIRGTAPSSPSIVSRFAEGYSNYYQKIFFDNVPSVDGLAITTDGYRPAHCAFYAGRVWYAGLPSGEKLGWIMYSQIVTDISKVENCYQQNDPTSEVISDLLETDGGIIQIPEAGNIVGMQPLGKGLVVFATNGVWMISGADAGFTPVNYTVDKVSNNGCFAPQSIVKANEFIYYWGISGIYRLKYSPSEGVGVESLTDTTIRTYLIDIPTFCKKYVEGKYNDSEKIVYWLYSDIVESKFRKNKLLCYDSYIGCFYTQTIDNSLDPTVVSIGVTKENTNITTTDVIDDSANLVVDDSANQVVADVLEESAGVQKVKFVTLVTTGGNKKLTFGEYSPTRTTFNDWVSYNNVGVDVASYVLTGYNLASSGPTKAKTGNYIVAFLKRTEETFDAAVVPTPPSSCLLQTRWDFTDNVIAGKWSDNIQLYRINRVFFGTPSTDYENGYPLVITKNKIRGRGKSIQMKYSSEAGKDMKLVGWSATFTSNSNV